MRICFSSISHADHPFIWDYDQTTNTAVCEFKLAGSPVVYENSELLSSLKKTQQTQPGIVIRSETEVVIEDMKTFLLSNPMMPIAELSKIHYTSSFFNHPKKEKNSNSAQNDLSTTTNTGSILGTQTNVDGGIRLENLINKEKNPGVWGNTLSHLEYFSKKTQLDQRNRTVDCIRGEIDLVKYFQYQENKELYPIKTSQMEVLLHIFNDLLAPLYDEIFLAEPLPVNFANYLATVVEDCLLNERLNYGQTTSEMLSKEEKEKKFRDENEFNFAVEQERIARVNVMLRPLIFFISPHMRASNLTMDSDIVNRLEKLKHQIKPDISFILAGYIDALRELTIKAGVLQFNFDCLNAKLKEQIATKIETIGHWHSCYNLIRKAFNLKFQGKENASTLNELTEGVIQEVIPLVISHGYTDFGKGHIGKVIKTDGDFYLSKTWAEHLARELDTFFSSTKIKRKELVQATAGFIGTFIAKHLMEHVPTDVQEESTGLAI